MMPAHRLALNLRNVCDALLPRLELFPTGVFVREHCHHAYQEVVQSPLFIQWLRQPEAARRLGWVCVDEKLAREGVRVRMALI